MAPNILAKCLIVFFGFLSITFKLQEFMPHCDSSYWRLAWPRSIQLVWETPNSTLRFFVKTILFQPYPQESTTWHPFILKFPHALDYFFMRTKLFAVSLCKNRHQDVSMAFWRDCLRFFRIAFWMFCGSVGHAMHLPVATSYSSCCCEIDDGYEGHD